MHHDTTGTSIILAITAGMLKYFAWVLSSFTIANITVAGAMDALLTGLSSISVLMAIIINWPKLMKRLKEMRNKK